MKTPILFLIVLFPLISSFYSCSDSQADLILTNAQIYTLNPDMAYAEALASIDGKIKAIGSNEEISHFIGPNTRVIDAAGHFVMPGFIEGHGHFSGLGSSLMNLNFLKSKNWQEILSMVEEKVKTTEAGEWITGRGWHQEKWDILPDVHHHGYPVHDQLSQVSPNNPVMLRHASGHSLFANQKAMDIAGINVESPNPNGGEIVRDDEGRAIGVFEERAMGSIRAAYQAYLNSLSQDELGEKWLDGIKLAQQECLSKGVTSFQDAGTRLKYLQNYEKLAKDGELDLRLWVMARDSIQLLEGNVGSYRRVDVGNGFYTCRAIKSEVDGALGAYGAWLLSSYNDKVDFMGQNTTTLEDVNTIAGMALASDMQLCVHAIGDRANQEVLNIFENRFKDSSKKDLRWRIEHAQHIDPIDIPRFKELEVIASMQGIHCTSDAPFVVKRLGETRAKEGSYPWRSLLDAGAVVTNGTDAPVEDVNPIESFYASVTRKRADNGMEFFPEQAMTRKEAIYSYTMANAYAAFEENTKGSLQNGKYTDFVVLSNNLLECPEDEILKTEILYTVVDGKVKFQK
jgi:predicted amidohydrolase YtcJ